MAVGAGVIRDRGPSKGLLNHEGKPTYSLEAIMACYRKHFVFIFGGGGEVLSEAWEGLEAEVQRVKAAMLAGLQSAGSGEELTFAKVEACV
jgi:hypothetical protein